MSNSSLVNYIKISPNSTNPRNHKIDKITIHHMAGNISVETCGNVFINRKASANYGIDSNGKVGMYVEEKNRSWASSSSSNDNRAVTIEVANDGGAPDWHVSDKALSKLIELCVDICKRNDIKEINYTGDTSGNLTMHQWFVATSCPGPYLKSKFSWIAQEVNKRLDDSTAAQTIPSDADIKIGDLVKIMRGVKYSTGKTVPNWVLIQNWYVKNIKNGIAIIDENEKHTNHINSPINAKFLTVIKSSSITVGDTVKIKDGAKTYTGGSLASFVYKREYKIKEIKGDRVVVTYAGITIAAVKLSDLIYIKR